MNGWRILGFALVFGAAVALRCLGISERPMHNDEAVNAIKFRQLWEHQGYKYDPNEHHGPTLYYATLVLEKLTGAPDFARFTEARLRLVTVVFGLGLILLLPLLRDGLGTSAMLWAALFTAVSPAMVFYSAYYIHEVLLVFFTLLAMVAGWRYWRSRKLAWALIAGAAGGLMWATKETFALSFAAAILALGLGRLWEHFMAASPSEVKFKRLRIGHLAAGLGAWLFVAVLLFSSFFTNASGVLDSLRTYGPWLQRAAGDSPHNHPWYFYFQRLIFFHEAKGPLWSEVLILALGMVGAGTGFVPKRLGVTDGGLVRFLALYTVLLAAAYSYISYKTTWCLLGFWQGMILLAGVGAAVLLRGARLPLARAALTLLLGAGAAQLAAQAWQASHAYAADLRNPYVYAQTSPDLLGLVDEIKALAQASPAGRDTVLKVVSAEDDYWPLPWYLREFRHIGWWRELPSDPYGPIMVFSANLHFAPDESRARQMGYFALRPHVLLELYADTALWHAYAATPRK